MSDIVVLGSLNMDLVVRTERMPGPGETIRGHHFITVPGGKGANQAAAAARLGARVEMIGRVGQDSFGPVLIDNMRRQGVGMSHVTMDPQAASGIAMIILDSQGENSIVVDPGANGCVALEDLDRGSTLLAEARYLLLQLEIPLPVVREAIARASALALPVILNAAPAYPLQADFVRGVHCLVVNESEAHTLTGIQAADPPSALRVGEVLLGWGVNIAIVTLGPQGACFVSATQRAHVPARQVPVVDTTAAGDAFIGGLAVAMLRGLDLGEAVRYATCAGTLATTVLGAQTSLPSAEQVEPFFQGGRP